MLRIVICAIPAWYFQYKRNPGYGSLFRHGDRNFDTLVLFWKKKMQITANMWFWQLSAIYQSQGKQPLQVFGYVNEFVLSVICNDIKLC